MIEWTEWIPFFQSLLWPALLAVALWAAWADLKRILSAVVLRIEQGDHFEAGTSGLKLGPSKALDKFESVSNIEKSIAAAELPNEIYIVHSARRDKKLDHTDLEYYRLRIWLDADETEILNDISSVIYHLHSSFSKPDRTVSDRASDFALVTVAWGQFNIWAEIKFKDNRPALNVERYINF